MIEQFPFRIRGFHSDNGSEFLNRTVEKLLNKLLIEQTKSRPRHSNDNGLVESKNGAVIRKHMGYTIAAPHAGRIQRFYQQHFNPYLNFHRPHAGGRGGDGRNLARQPGADHLRPRRRTTGVGKRAGNLPQRPDGCAELRPGSRFRRCCRGALGHPPAHRQSRHHAVQRPPGTAREATDSPSTSASRTIRPQSASSR